jgi:LmbE family N-acetylglucosaminyl deacetylase
MIRLGLTGTQSPLRVLCLGAHPDDIEIGCGGTILRLIEEHPDIQFQWVVFSGLPPRDEEARRAAAEFAGVSRLDKLLVMDFRDGFLPFVGERIKLLFEELKNDPAPDLIFTHSRDDAHQDHRLIAELTWNTFRDHLILEYEIPKYDGDVGRPGVFVPLPSEMAQKKVQALYEVFRSQQTKRWFQPELFFSLMRLRGMESNAPSGYAEAFYCRKLVL